MTVAFQILGLTLVLLAAQAVVCRAGKWVVWGLFAAVPVVLLPSWVLLNQFDPFLWTKIFTIFACNVWGAAVRHTPLGKYEWARRSLPLLVAVNILEAMAVDLAAGGVAHLLNSAAGLGLVLTLPYRRDAVRVADTPGRDVRVPTSRGWVVGYTLWNWAFVLMNYPEYVGYHTAVLVSALAVGLIDPARWTQTRAATLGLNFLMMATCDAPMRAWLGTASWADPILALCVAGAAVVVAVGCGVQPVFGLVGRMRLRTAGLLTVHGYRMYQI
ncbi:MAG: DUF5692 family protein [Armatimonadaceae bacterium]